MLSTELSLEFEEKVLRIVDRDGEPWFVLADVCRAIGIKNVTDAARTLDPDEKAELGLTKVSSGQRRRMVIVSEPGAMQIILRSDAAITQGTFAHRFRRWVSHEVLPSIRKYGVYPPPPITELPEPDWCDGTDKLLHERFLEERLRWEAASGMGLHEIPGFSKPVIRAIEAGLGGIDKGQRVRMLTLAGLDVLYILSGLRTVSPTERRAIAYIRESSDPRKLALLAAISSS